MWGNSPSTTPTRLFRLDFPPHLNQFCLGEPPNFPFFIIFWQDSIKGERRSTHQHAPLSNLPNLATFLHPTTSYLYPSKVSSMSCRAILCCQALLEGHFPCIFQNIFYFHSPCSYFGISATCPDHPTTSSFQRSRCTTDEGCLRKREILTSPWSSSFSSSLSLSR